GKRGGKPCIRGMRITVYEVLDYLASGMSEAEILADFPDLTAEDLKACLAFAAVMSLARALQVPPAAFFQFDWEEKDSKALRKRIDSMLQGCNQEQLQKVYRITKA